MIALQKANQKAVDRFRELCPDFFAMMIAHLVEGWVLAVDVDGHYHYCHAGMIQGALESLADVDPAHRGGYIRGVWDGAGDTRAAIIIKPGR